VSTSIVDNAVLDANTLVRATVPPIHPQAVEWLRRVHAQEVTAWAPDIVHTEGANALRNYERARILTAASARAHLTYYLAIPLRLAASRRLLTEAFELAVVCGLSVYDATYLALARALNATLVTADRRLAEHHDRVALLA
jgi:predicted nucleic acid-binding protein